MKTLSRFLSALFLAGLTLGFVACQKESAPATPDEPAAPAVTESSSSNEDSMPVRNQVTLDTLDQRVSYAIGKNIATEMSTDTNIDVDAEALIAGIRDTLAGAEPRLNEQEIGEAFQGIRDRVQEAERAAIAAEHERATKFLTANGSRAEVTTTETGLQYEILEAGDGVKPTTNDKVRVHYHGTLVDGTVFDSSVQRGEPIEFPVTGVIPGWVEALQLMPAGSKWKLAIPPALAYGDRATGRIPAGSALIFEVELLDVISPEPAEPAAEATE